MKKGIEIKKVYRYREYKKHIESGRNRKKRDRTRERRHKREEPTQKGKEDTKGRKAGRGEKRE